MTVYEKFLEISLLQLQHTKLFHLKPQRIPMKNLFFEGQIQT